MRHHTANWAAVVAVRSRAAGLQRKESFFIIQDDITMSPAVARKEIWKERSSNTKGLRAIRIIAVAKSKTPPRMRRSKSTAKSAKAEKRPARQTGGWAPVIKMKKRRPTRVSPAAPLRLNWRARKTKKNSPAMKA